MKIIFDFIKRNMIVVDYSYNGQSAQTMPKCEKAHISAQKHMKICESKHNNSKAREMTTFFNL